MNHTSWFASELSRFKLMSLQANAWENLQLEQGW